MVRAFQAMPAHHPAGSNALSGPNHFSAGAVHSPVGFKAVQLGGVHLTRFAGGAVFQRVREMLAG